MSEVVDLALARIERAGPVLRAASSTRVLDALEAALAAMSDPSSPVGREAYGSIAERSGLSASGAAWALETTLVETRGEKLREALDHMARATAGYRGTPVRSHAIVLAGNVFTSCVRPMVWSLLARVPMIVKLASGDEGLAELFGIALTTCDPELGEAIAIVHGGGSSAAIYGELAARVDLVSAFGGDHAIGEMRGKTSATTDFVAHGHGLGAAVVLRDALSSDVDGLCARLALDVAAYDQRGCLSPQVVFVEKGGELGPRDLADRLATHGLAPLARSMPRGALPVQVGAQQVQWRGLASSLHELFEGDGYAVSYEGPSGLRPTPGYRNVAVHAIESAAELATRLGPLGAHLKVLGVAGDEARLALPSPLSPRICPLGQMQRPPLLAATDGLPPWQGLVRLG
ncbi:MAG: acyl-CoA reductase [Sandaracinus sp.]